MSKDVEALLAEIQTMNLDAQRALWRARFGSPPKMRSEPILRMLLAWRVQAAAFGGLDAATLRALARTGPVQPEGRGLGVGARLTRTWKGREVTVIVMPAASLRTRALITPPRGSVSTAIMIRFISKRACE